MKGAKPTLGYESRGDAVMALLQQGLDVREIAERIGSNRRAVGCILRHTRKRRGIQGPPRLVLTRAAHARGLTLQELEARLLDVVARKNLVALLLDETAGEAD